MKTNRRSWRENSLLCASARALKAANPNATQSEIARTMGLHRNSVGYFLGSRCKAAGRTSYPEWAPQLIEGARAIGENKLSRAANLFAQLVVKLMEGELE